MNYLLSFQFCLNFGNLCIYRDVSSRGVPDIRRRILDLLYIRIRPDQDKNPAGQPDFLIF